MRYAYSIFAFLATMLVGAVGAGTTEYATTKQLAIAMIALILIACFALSPERGDIRLIFLVIGTVSLTASIIMILVGAEDSNGRLTLFGLNPIPSARLAGVAPLIALAVLFRSSRPNLKNSIVALLTLAPALFAIVLTGSRGPFLAFFISALTVFLIRIKSLAIWQITSFVAITTLGLATLFNTANESSTIGRITLADGSGRDHIFRESINLLKEHPFGIGWGNLLQELPSLTYIATGDTLYSHNILLEIGTEGGWFPLIFFVILICIGFLNVARASRAGSTDALLVMSVLCYSLLGAMFSSDISGNRLLWVALGLSLLNYNPASRENIIQESLSLRAHGSASKS